MMDWTIFLAIVCGAVTGWPAGWFLAGLFIRRRNQRRAIERRLANWAG